MDFHRSDCGIPILGNQKLEETMSKGTTWSKGGPSPCQSPGRTFTTPKLFPATSSQFSLLTAKSDMACGLTHARFT